MKELNREVEIGMKKIPLITGRLDTPSHANKINAIKIASTFVYLERTKHREVELATKIRSLN